MYTFENFINEIKPLNIKKASHINLILSMLEKYMEEHGIDRIDLLSQLFHHSVYKDIKGYGLLELQNKISIAYGSTSQIDPLLSYIMMIDIMLNKLTYNDIETKYRYTKTKLYSRFAFYYKKVVNNKNPIIDFVIDKKIYKINIVKCMIIIGFPCNECISLFPDIYRELAKEEISENQFLQLTQEQLDKEYILKSQVDKDYILKSEYKKLEDEYLKALIMVEEVNNKLQTLLPKTNEVIMTSSNSFVPKKLNVLNKTKGFD